MAQDVPASPHAIINIMELCGPAKQAETAEASINKLYQQIKENPFVLEKFDEKPFAETPLHKAASAGRVELATEIIRLKPSFAWKLDEEGLSPMHHALQNRHYKMVRRFVSINKDLVRVKGKMGLTPLHQLVAPAADKEQTKILAEQIEILAEFLEACPDSIGDLTVAGETALHVAVNGRKFEALQVLVGWLRRCSYYQPGFVDSILNWKNESGDTILHVSVLNNDSQIVAFLNKNGIKLNDKDSEDKVTNAGIKKLLTAASVLFGDDVHKDKVKQTLADKLKKKITTVDVIAIKIERQRRSMIDATTRSALVAVAILIATMTYQSALSPPGGFHSPPDSADSTSTPAPAPAPAGSNLLGKSVMSKPDFNFFFISNSLTLLASTIVIYLLMPIGTWVTELVMPWVFIYFVNGYLMAMEVIRPYDGLESVFTGLRVANVIFYCSFPLMRAVVHKKVEKALIRGNRNMESMPASGENRW